MSITAFFAVCILSIDFMIYFFFKLVYGEKHRAKPRRLPSEYYSASSAYLVPARKDRPTRTGNILSMPPGKPQLSGAKALAEQRNAVTPSGDSAELAAHRRIVSLYAHAGSGRKAS